MGRVRAIGRRTAAVARGRRRVPEAAGQLPDLLQAHIKLRGSAPKIVKQAMGNTYRGNFMRPAGSFQSWQRRTGSEQVLPAANLEQVVGSKPALWLDSSPTPPDCLRPQSVWPRNSNLACAIGKIGFGPKNDLWLKSTPSPKIAPVCKLLPKTAQKD